MIYKRNISSFILETIATRPIIYLNGSRQVGKTTLVQNIDLNSNKKKKNKPQYITFDSPATLFSAKNDPDAFIKSLNFENLIILDEVQLVPEIFRLLKIEVDRYRKKGKSEALFLLTGSANLMALPILSDALVGRMSVINLYPFSVSEYFKSDKNFIENFFEKDFFLKEIKKKNIISLIKNATYPEIAKNKKIDRTKWFDDYLTTIIQRDINFFLDAQKSEKIISLFSILANRASGLINDASIASDASLDIKTYKKYKSIIMNTSLIFELKPWTKLLTLKKRFIKSSKLYFADTNILSYIMNRSLENIEKNDHTIFGRLFENFVATEIIKNLSPLTNIKLYHFRTYEGREVDFVLEKNNGEVIGIEVKLSNTVTLNDTKGLLELKKIAGKMFKKGMVFYTGTQLIPLSKDIWAVPVYTIWEL